MSDETTENVTDDAGPKAVRYAELPDYARHLMRVRVPVMVNLAAKKMPIREVVELGPGSMISFEKSCDAPLELAVGEQPLAIGSAVKIGEKFGLEISEITLPGEHFHPVCSKQAS